MTFQTVTPTTSQNPSTQTQQRVCHVCKTPLAFSFGLAHAGDFVLACDEKLHDPNKLVTIRETCFKCSMKMVRF